MILGLLQHVLQVAIIVLFPVLAIRTRRGEGSGLLWRVTAMGVGLILLLAAVAASPSAGNAIAPTYGYGYTAPRVMLLFGLTLGLPLVSVAVAVHVLADSIRSQLGLYAIAVICAGLAWFVGVLASIRILFTT